MGVKKHLLAIFALTAALTAILGAGSASATVLCNESATKCTSYGKGAIVDSSLKETSTFSSTGGTVLDTCTFGLVEGKTSNAGGSSETVSETIEGLTWGSCSNTTDTTSKGELEIHWISGTGNGTVTGKSISVTLNTSFGSCTYGTGTALDLGTLTGGNPATIDINTILAKQAGGFLCPAEAKWAASYSVTSPQPLYIGESAVAGAPMLWLENSGGMPVPQTRMCEFKLRLEVCKFTVWNYSGVPVVITISEVTPPLNRYEIINEECKVKNKIASGGFCTAEIQLKAAAPEAGWFNGFQFQVEEEGSKGTNKAGITGGLRVV